MLRHLSVLLVVVVCVVSNPVSAQAPDLAIRNVKVFVGNGRVISSGTVIVSGEQILGVVEGVATGRATREIDGQGMTLLPGLIDTHVHLITGPTPSTSSCGDLPAESLEGMLREGITTAMSVGDSAAEILATRNALRDATLSGPRLLVTGPVFAAPDHPGGKRENFCNGQFPVKDEAITRQEIRRLATAQVDAIKILHDSAWPPKIDPTLVTAIVDEATKAGLPVMAHVQTTEDAREAISLGVSKLVHMPHLGQIDGELLATLRDRRTPITTTVHLFAPINSTDGKLLNHGEREIPLARVPAVQQHLQEVLNQVRLLQDAGLKPAFGTDRYRGEATQQTAYMHEIETLSRVMSPVEVLQAMTLNAAEYLGLGSEIGSIELGKRADMVLVEGDATKATKSLANVRVVIQGGQVVIDKRAF